MPLFRRAGWRCLYDLANPTDGIMRTNFIWPLFYGNDSTLRANGYTGIPATTDARADVNWIAKRQTNLWARLAEVRPQFKFLTTNGTVFSNPTATITGLAPVEVKVIQLNGTLVDATWTTDTNWSVTTSLSLGTNLLEIIGFGRKTNELPVRDIGGYTTNISVRYQP